MSKLKLFAVFLIYCNIALGFWGKSKAPESCSGTVFYNNKCQELADLKLGPANKNIVAYLKPENDNQSLIEYEFSLKETKEIKLVKVSPLIHKSKKYLNIEVISNNSPTPIECIINSDKRLIGKHKQTEATIKYPLDTIDRVEFKSCKPEEEHAQLETKKLLDSLNDLVKVINTTDNIKTVRKEAESILKDTNKNVGKE